MKVKEESQWQDLMEQPFSLLVLTRKDLNSIRLTLQELTSSGRQEPLVVEEKQQ